MPKKMEGRLIWARTCPDFEILKNVLLRKIPPHHVRPWPPLQRRSFGVLRVLAYKQAKERLPCKISACFNELRRPHVDRFPPFLIYLYMPHSKNWPTVSRPACQERVTEVEF
ncbi:hypothetical protein GCK32_010550 [Trichostrongylus colubriformis]|uniref:Uncharacterized protein n=1 Tax=Trichostrongylus colubriformis TaxID=6319 RepID=A0AAN8G2Y3_TRICO